jgi:hypothetical protein
MQLFLFRLTTWKTSKYNTVELPFPDTSTLRTVLLSPEFLPSHFPKQVPLPDGHLDIQNCGQHVPEIFVIPLANTDTIGKHVGLITLNNVTPGTDVTTMGHYSLTMEVLFGLDLNIPVHHKIVVCRSTVLYGWVRVGVWQLSTYSCIVHALRFTSNSHVLTNNRLNEIRPYYIILHVDLSTCWPYFKLYIFLPLLTCQNVDLSTCRTVNL